MNIQTPVRLSVAEEVLVSQLESTGATDAAERLRVIGLPTARQSYHYTDLKTLLSAVPPRKTGTCAAAIDIPGSQVVIANGEVQNTGTAPNGSSFQVAGAT